MDTCNEFLSTGDLFIVHFFLFVFNFVASIIQGLTGFGDAIVLHVMWQSACAIAPCIFNMTALGSESFKVVTLLMYVRIIFSAPLLAYWSMKDGLFSLGLTIAMAIPSTITALLGVWVFKGSKDNTLKMVLGISSLIFAVVYLLIMVFRVVQKQRKSRQLAAKRKRNATPHHGSPPEPAASAVSNSSFSIITKSGKAKDVLIVSETQLVEQLQQQNTTAAAAPSSSEAPLSLADLDTQTSPLGGRLAHQDSTTATRDASRDSRLNEIGKGDNDDNDSDSTSSGELHVLHSIRGSPFTIEEATTRVNINESNAPPLSPSMLSPLETMTYTRVRVNRNLDENGKIRLSTKIGASFFAALSGIMGSLTGVGGPAQIIFILLFDVPNYIIKVNFCFQSIPSAAIRFILALTGHLLTVPMIPFLITTLLAGYLGIYVGSKMGKLVGPKSYNVFVLCLLLLSSLIMLTHNVVLLLGAMFATFGVTIVMAYWELKKEKPIVEGQKELERRLEQQERGEAHGGPSSFEGRSPTTTTTSDDDDATDPLKERQYPPSSTNDSFSSNGRRVRKAELCRPPPLFLGDTPHHTKMVTKFKQEKEEDVSEKIKTAEESLPAP